MGSLKYLPRIGKAMLPVGTCNYTGVLIGVQGSGKSYLGNRIAQEWTRGAYVLIHDPTGSYQGSRFHTINEAEQAISNAQTQWPIIVDCDDGMEVLRLAVRVSGKARGVKDAWRDPTPGKQAIPTLCVIDEAVDASNMSPSYMHPEVRRAIMKRRHLHLGLLLGSQRPQEYHPALIQYASVLYCFRAPLALKQRLANLSIPPEVLDEIPNLPNYEHYQIKFGDKPIKYDKDLKQVSNPANTAESADSH